MSTRLRGWRCRIGSERGASALELVLYMPLLVIMMFLTIQFSLIYLGNQVVSAAARQAARVARTGAGTDAAMALGQQSGQQFLDLDGYGLVTGASVTMSRVADPGGGGFQVRADVQGTAIQLVPIVALTTVRQWSQGPIETFRADTP